MEDNQIIRISTTKMKKIENVLKNILIIFKYFMNHGFATSSFIMNIKQYKISFIESIFKLYKL